MPVPSSSVPWWGSLVWLVAVAGIAFLVAWVTGTRLRIKRSVYIPMLFVTTAVLAVGYVAWLGIEAGELVTARLGWGVLAGIGAGLLLARAIKRQPVDRHVPRHDLPAILLWEGVVYGTAEGVLLAGLPAFIAWQMVHSTGWTGVGGAVARWAIPLLAAAAVIVIHHLGYWNCRNRILVPITLGCSVLTTVYLVTASFLAPAVGHIVMHFGAVLHGVEMPPKERPTSAEARPPLQSGAGLRAA
jgi:hypothetical protein